MATNAATTKKIAAMTDIRDIYSTREAYNHKVKDVQEPFIAELLLSLIISLTILSGILFLRWFVDTIEISMYAQFVTLILPAVLTFIRRKYPKLLPCLLLKEELSPIGLW